MKVLQVKDIIAAVEGTILRGDKQQLIKYAAINQRKLRRHSLYFDFRQGNIKSAVRPLTIVTENPSKLRLNYGGLTIIQVEDINQAYAKFVRYYRNLFNFPVIGVTGTCGKTTTTEMLKKILSKQYSLRATQNGNNALARNLGYLLSFNERTQAAVFEMGVSSPGTVSKSCAFFQPEVGVILNIGTYHLLGCGTLEAYIKAKAELLEGLKSDGTLIINADDNNIRKISFGNFKGNIIKIGLGEGCDYRGRDICYAEGGMSFLLVHKGKKHAAFVPGYGEHNVYNALAAIAASVTVGIPLKSAINYLADFKPMRKHLQFRRGIKGSTIIDDTWNCTPPSIEVALKVLNETAKGRRKVAVIGHMPQLGQQGKGEYQKAGAKVVEAKVDFLLIIGQEAKGIGERAIALGMQESQVAFINSGDELHEVLEPLMDDNALILFKFPFKYRLRKIPSFLKFMKAIFDE